MQYGMPPQQGYGGMPPQQGYGGMPQQGYGQQMQGYGQQQGYDQQMQGYGGGQVLWRLYPGAGIVPYNVFSRKNQAGFPYSLQAGDEQILSRWNMMIQSLYVSRIQATVSVYPDGRAILTSNGKAPTLWRPQGGQWNALYKGQQHALTSGDQVSVDANNPECGLFTCQAESGMQPGSYGQQQGGYGQQGGEGS